MFCVWIMIRLWSLFSNVIHDLMLSFSWLVGIWENHLDFLPSRVMWQSVSYVISQTDWQSIHEFCTLQIQNSHIHNRNIMECKKYNIIIYLYTLNYVSKESSLIIRKESKNYRCDAVAVKTFFLFRLRRQKASYLKKIMLVIMSTRSMTNYDW